MRIANSQPIWLTPEAPCRAEKTATKKSVTAPQSVMPPSASVASPAILFGNRKSAAASPETPPQDPKLAAEIERVTQRAPKIFGKPLVTKEMKPLWQKRALYNLKADPAALTECLPYRQLLVQKKDVASLKQYDALVETLMNKAEFYEAEKLKPLKKAVNKLYLLQNSSNQAFEKNGIDTLWKQLKLYASFPFSVKARNTLFKIVMEFMQENAQHIPDQTLSEKLVQPGVKSLQDASTRYLVAASIADLLFKSPEQAKQQLNNPKHPMRFILGTNHTWLSLGQFKPGFNLIFLNEDSLWQEAAKGIKKPSTSQHEFVHALSDPAGGEVLPSMSDDQKHRFLKARDELQTLFSKKDSGPMGWIRRLWNGHTATGLRGYAFFNNLEFLTVSSDTFKSKPQELCRTQPGKEIYQIYNDIFKIDPLKDFSRLLKKSG